MQHFHRIIVLFISEGLVCVAKSFENAGVKEL